MKTSKSGKRMALTAGLILLVLAASIGIPPTYEAVATLPGTQFQLAILLRPMHPYLSEYNRSAELRLDGETIEHRKLFPDTGGYSRTHLYELEGGDFLILGYFDALRVDVSMPAMVDAEPKRPSRARYLGAFESGTTRRWRFADPSISSSSTGC